MFKAIVSALVVVSAFALGFVEQAIAQQAMPTGAAALDQIHTIAEFKFENGMTIKNLKVGYDLYGKLNEAKDNAIVVGHGASGGRKQYLPYIGPGKLFDTERYLIIAPDAIGGGLSSSPKDGMGPDFPAYNVRDMMRAEHDLVTRGLGLTGLRAVHGGSLGSQIALEWSIHHPDFMRGVVLFAPSARIDVHARLFFQAVRDVIMLDPKYRGGHYTENPEAGLRLAGLIYSPWLLSDAFLDSMKTPEQYKMISNILSNPYAAWDANSLIYRYRNDHDVAIPFGGDQKLALSKVKAKVLVVASSTDRTLAPFLAREISDGVTGAVYLEIQSIRGHAAVFQGDEKSPEYIFLTGKTKTFLDSLGP